MLKRTPHLLKLLPLLVMLVVLGCAKRQTQVALFWPYDLWDGMNRLVFALEELDYEIYSVDTDNGTIMARRWPTDKDRAAQTGFDSRRPYELRFEFPVDPKMPILIREIPPGPRLAGLSERNLHRIVEEIARKFQQFGGVVEEVKLED